MKNPKPHGKPETPPRQQAMKQAAQEARERDDSLQPNDIAEKTNMKRQQKDMHSQSGK